MLVLSMCLDLQSWTKILRQCTEAQLPIVDSFATLRAQKEPDKIITKITEGSQKRSPHKKLLVDIQLWVHVYTDGLKLLCIS